MAPEGPERQGEGLDLPGGGPHAHAVPRGALVRRLFYGVLAWRRRPPEVQTGRKQGVRGVVRGRDGRQEMPSKPHLDYPRTALICAVTPAASTGHRQFVKPIFPVPREVQLMSDRGCTPGTEASGAANMSARLAASCRASTSFRRTLTAPPHAGTTNPSTTATTRRISVRLLRVLSPHAASLPLTLLCEVAQELFELLRVARVAAAEPLKDLVDACGVDVRAAGCATGTTQ